jgi:two-component system NtrC family sensor kinase
MPGVVSTIGERCRRCYTCVRHCPAKAIRVRGGQAEVLPERCIGCGNCIRVCTQAAKRVESEALPLTREWIGAGEHVVACLAPSFAGLVPEARPRQVVTAARRLGFAEVMEVAAGADLVGRAYRSLVAELRTRAEAGEEVIPFITSPCPALVSYIEKYLPELVPALAPIVSPMIALGRLVKQRLHPGAKVVFIGPCVAKKAEARDPAVAGAVDAALTFRELADWLAEEKVEVRSLPEGRFDGPRPGVGRIFPVSGGLLRTAGLAPDVLDPDVVVTEGVDRTTELLRAVERGGVRGQLFDLLFCEGCINGPFAGTNGHGISSQQMVVDYTNEEIAQARTSAIDAYADLDLSRTFADAHIAAPQPTEEEVRAILRQTNKTRPEDELNCGACGYTSCRDKAAAVFQGLAESEMCLPYLIDKLEQTVAELATSRRELLEAEEQLIHREKLASMGQLAAGVAHEINNPLGTVLIYSNMMLKELAEGDVHRADAEMIAREADRCRHIVGNLLDFARQSKGEPERTDMNALVEETVSLVARQGGLEQVRVVTDLAPDLPEVEVDREQLKQAFINIVKNASEAMPEGGELRLRTSLAAGRDAVRVEFSDTGCGILEENLERIFHPFFTTKQIGKGTGLGLAITYGIVKMHRGGISVDSKVGAGTTFTVTLPVSLTGRLDGRTDAANEARARR